MDRSGTLLYDADCGLCVATATWLAGRVSPSKLGLLPFQQVGSDGRIAALVAGLDLAESVRFVRADDAVLSGAAAALAAGRLVPLVGWYAALWDRPLGHWFLEPVYREVSSHRRRIGGLLGLPASCPLTVRRVEPGERSRTAA